MICSHVPSLRFFKGLSAMATDLLAGDGNEVGNSKMPSTLFILPLVLLVAAPTVEGLIPDEAWQQLEESISGQVVLPASPLYPNASVQWNNRFTTTPAGIVYVTSTGDVAKTLQFAHQYVGVFLALS